MREMVLNNASLTAPDLRTAVSWLIEVTVGMSTLVDASVVSNALRMNRSPYEIRCLPDRTLSDLFQDVRQQGEHDRYLFLLALSTKTPLLNDVDQLVANRFRACQQKSLPQEDGSPLLYCAITDSIAVGFPADPEWAQEQLTVDFDELLLNGEVVEVSEIIDNLTQSRNAQSISERHRAHVREGLRQFADSDSFWEEGYQAFPHLVMAPGVESCVAALDPGALQIVVKKLASLDDSVAEWRDTSHPSPQWRCMVTNESESVRNNPLLRDARKFRSVDGSLRLFMYHARFGKSGRIHFRLDLSSYQAEIGYIGSHLPL